MTVQGVDVTEQNMLKVASDVLIASEIGVFKTGLLVQRTAQLKAPVDLGNLKASAYTHGKRQAFDDPSWVKEKKEKDEKTGRIVVRTADPVELSVDHANAKNEATGRIRVQEQQLNQLVVVGFSANYAIYVHENHRTKSDFLRSAITESSDTLLMNVAREIKRVLP